VTFDLQNLIVLAVVAAAASYLLRSIRRSIVKRAAAGCGTCATCPSGRKAASDPMVVEISGPQRDSAH